MQLLAKVRLLDQVANKDAAIDASYRRHWFFLENFYAEVFGHRHCARAYAWPFVSVSHVAFVARSFVAHAPAADFADALLLPPQDFASKFFALGFLIRCKDDV